MTDPVRGTGSLAGMSALITGGDSALVLACARRLAADGAMVTICGTAEQHLKESAGAYGMHYAIAGVTEEDQVAAALAAAATGPLRIVIASARGSASIGPISQLNAAGLAGHARPQRDRDHADAQIRRPRDGTAGRRVVRGDLLHRGQHLRRGPDYAAAFEPIFGAAAALRGLPEEPPRACGP